MYHLIELKQRKLLISRQTLTEIKSFTVENWLIFERLSDFGLVIAMDVVDPVEELQKKSGATITEDSIIRPALGGK